VDEHAADPEPTSAVPWLLRLRPPGPGDEAPASVAAADPDALPADTLVESRYEKFRRMGKLGTEFIEAP